ncbi:MAG TPA: CvpA family protein [Candidatus Scatomonas pullistercoris]|uniref:CvpA family protein n=1 Tax=Candidatus Scatomonas pullistercoris TaxID=2840920 RepID=A0A9D1TA78_9FIRM|nr:CvpA family protein [Candidatus Scatomonas pullistercoris]
MKSKRLLKKIIFIVALAAAAFLYYYIQLPAINIHSQGFWGFLILLAAVLVAVLRVLPLFRRAREYGETSDLKNDKPFRIGILAVGALVVIFIVGSILSSTVVNAKKYQKLLTVEDGDFTADIQEMDIHSVPMLDKDSATILGNRKMGSLADMVSQFEVAEDYTQINLNDVPVRVSPLKYAGFIKWFTNQSEGIPGYMQIDMTTQNTELVRLDQPIKYSKGEYFNRNIYRHLRFKYPTYIFDNINFEIDDEGTPWWICPVKKYTIGLFGGQTIGRVVLCNAQTGECQDLAVEEVPQWVDKVYSAELLTRFYDYYGTLQHGWLNSVLGQKDCLRTTDGYNYLAINDDVWVYTGVTSVTSDQSIVGFVLMNQRTGETKYYSVTGAVESSAMRSAEGQVQDLGYTATFPLLLNINEQPTYFLALKDGSGLVKKYALVNVQKYQIVAIGDTLEQCRENYQQMMADNDMAGAETETIEISGTIAKITPIVQEGDTHYYLELEGDRRLFDVNVAENLKIIQKDVGDKITFACTENEEVCTVTEIHS